MKKIAVIILNWNNAPDTLECLESVVISSYPQFDIYVVDNGSSDGSAKSIYSAFPQVKMLLSPTNLGFAEGNNRAIAKAFEEGAEYVFLLNNDAVIHKHALSILEQAARDNPQAALFGPKIYFYDDPTAIWYAGAGWNRDTASFYHRDWGIQEREAHPRQIGPTEYVCGCALFAKREPLEKIGLMDPRFFLNWEEIDWCFRLRRAGFECLYVPSAKAWHKISRSFIGGKQGAMWRYFYHRNRLLWMEKNIPIRERTQLILQKILPEFCKACKAALHGSAEGKVILRAVFDYVRRKFGAGPYQNLSQ